MNCPFCIKITLKNIDENYELPIIRCGRCKFTIQYDELKKVSYYVFSKEDIWFNVKKDEVYMNGSFKFSLNLRNKSIEEIIEIYNNLKENKMFA